jgi:hypothetical protein
MHDKIGRLRPNRDCGRIDYRLCDRNLRPLAIAIGKDHSPSEQLRTLRNGCPSLSAMSARRVGLVGVVVR